MSNSLAKPVAEKRFVFIDALRGIAALLVLLFHMLHNSVMEVTLRGALPGFVQWISDYGSTGVQIFFVLSGFVIAHSLRNNALTLKSVGNFALRRQIRLDPPYWFMMVVSLILHRVELAIPSLKTEPMPGVVAILANFFYLHKILDVEKVMDVSWTLCIEIQFYISFILILLAAKFLAKSLKHDQLFKSGAALIFVTGLASMVALHFFSIPHWFTQQWYYFAAGVLCYWAFRGLISQWVFLAFMGLFALNTASVCFTNVISENENVTGKTIGEGMIVGLVTATAIYLVARKGRLTEFGKNPILQYFGKISYSLYLVHLPVLVMVLRVAYKITGENKLMAIVWYLIAGALSVGASHLLFMFIEQPSMRYATKFKEARGKEVEPPNPTENQATDEPESSSNLAPGTA